MEKTMKKKNGKFTFWAAALLAVLLVSGLVAAGCSTDGGKPEEIDTGLLKKPAWSLDELLRKYMGPNLQTWDEGTVNVYYLDPSRFNAFKAELDAGGEYTQIDEWTEENRTWDRDRAFARWAVKSEGTSELDLCRADNSQDVYGYEPVSSGN
jgi:hypothetical protein